MLPIPKLQVDVNAEHSCNWKCCWGCKCVDVKSPVSEIEETETVTKVTRVVHRHGFPKSAPVTPNATPRSQEEKE